MNRLVFFVAFCVILDTPLVSFAAEFSQGIKDRDAGNYEDAARIFRVAAEEGDKYAQHCLGVMLYKGLGLEQNFEESFKWLDLAAKQGLLQAQLDLGVLIYHKKGIPKDFVDKYN